MKKKILFAMNNLHCGGAEKSLLSLLQTIDYSRYDIDLFLFKHEGLFLSKIPQEVNLLAEPIEYSYFDMPIKTAIVECLKRGRPDIALLRVCSGFVFRTEKNRARCEQRVWKYISKSLKSIKREYDVAIGYLEKNPVYFCIDKVKTNNRIGFIHTDYEKLGMDPCLDKGYFEKLNHIVTVSEECGVILKRIFPEFEEKIEVIANIVSPSVIEKMSLEEVEIQKEGITICSVGRLHYLKGFDLAVEACEILVQKGYKVRWYVIGEGGERSNLEQLIRRKNLEKNFILLGLKENPYPYIRKSNIYVHPSRFEGKSIAIDEAKMLKKPIVVTNFNTVKDQVEDEKNGIIVEINSRSIAEGINNILNDKDLTKQLTFNLSKEKIGTESEINKLYKLVN